MADEVFFLPSALVFNVSGFSEKCRHGFTASPPPCALVFILFVYPAAETKLRCVFLDRRDVSLSFRCRHSQRAEVFFPHCSYMCLSSGALLVDASPPARACRTRHIHQVLGCGCENAVLNYSPWVENGKEPFSFLPFCTCERKHFSMLSLLLPLLLIS